MENEVLKNDFVERLRQKPEKIKQRLFYGIFALVAIVLFGGWLLFIKLSPKTEKPPLFSGLAEDVQILKDSVDRSGSAIGESTKTYKEIRNVGKASVSEN